MYRMATAASTDTGLNLSASYTYTEQDNYLSSLDYGNGDKVQYTYDDQGRVTKQTYEDGATVTYRYNNDGALATVTDSATGRTTTYYYDFIDRMMKYVETGSGYSHTVGYEYDTINNLTSLVESINGTDYTNSYSYDKDNRVTSIAGGEKTTNEEGKSAIDNAVIKDYSYDGFGRVSSQQTSKYEGAYVVPVPTEEAENAEGTESTQATETTPDPNKTVIKTDSFAFTAPGNNATSSQVSQHTIDAADYDKTFVYTYDDNGNILSISDGTNTISYVYDSANQLIRENNQAGGFTHIWAYDSAGNILSRAKYDYTPDDLGTLRDTVTYTYGDDDWGDLLTSYDGKTITHDVIGNPRNDGTWSYEWQHGRQLKSMSDGTTTWNFTYNADGLRTKRTNGTTTYNYVYNGDKLSQMTVGSNLLQFSYDAAGTPMTVLYNGTTYYYATNLQGDVIAILDATGAAVVEYTYDAWGNLLTTDGSMKDTFGTTNPLRYRSYIYDTETQLYYLQSRYYNPEVGRFLNADCFATDGQNLLISNVFQYCLNNPIIYSDPFGTSAHNAAQPWLCTCASCMGYDRFVGVGAQLELDAGSYECGIEVIVYFDSTVCNGENPIVSVYVYEGAAVDLFNLYTNPDLINTIETLTAALATNACPEAYGKAELIQLQSLLFADASVSASVLGVYGYSNFASPEDYEGAFSTIGVSAFRGKVTYSYSPSCWVIGVGASTSKKPSFSFGQTNYTLIT